MKKELFMEHQYLVTEIDYMEITISVKAPGVPRTLSTRQLFDTRHTRELRPLGPPPREG